MGISLGLNINIGAYGWRHSHWSNSFYPDDLPEDWQLAYYSNEISTVLVPASYLQTCSALDCEAWLDSVHEGFQFFVECNADMLGHISVQTLIDCLQQLKPQLTALVFLDDVQVFSEDFTADFACLIRSLDVPVFGANTLFDTISDIEVKNIWPFSNKQVATLAFITDDLTDLRVTRTDVESFIKAGEKSHAKQEMLTVIANHPRLQASDIIKFRSVLDIMGY